MWRSLIPSCSAGRQTAADLRLAFSRCRRLSSIVDLGRPADRYRSVPDPLHLRRKWGTDTAALEVVRACWLFQADAELSPPLALARREFAAPAVWGAGSHG